MWLFHITPEQKVEISDIWEKADKLAFSEQVTIQQFFDIIAEPLYQNSAYEIEGPSGEGLMLLVRTQTPSY